MYNYSPEFDRKTLKVVEILRRTIMKLRRSFLVGRAAAFAVLLITAGATSISVASGTEDARQSPVTGDSRTAGLALASASTETTQVHADF